ncbi:unnamed protein product [Thlaspi arvense]|uniref:5'-3' DNA helicase ZGRF1-like N-terminal domain-containing protein n=1 Tax=Thlaspi arvense TaxID=13288 RepID=A0AAU9SSM3_THLAR|nr:unnamed protein product [Thlaspi arvense]
MAEKKRWIAMYTKHIKQKRKVYHDGFLDFEITRRKVMLYDEADNLLESKMLKADEVVSSGESLTFQAYLVDICEPKEGSMASSDPIVQPSDQGCARKSFAVLRPNFKKSYLHSEEKKPNIVNKFPSNSLSPSHKMIRVFKKRELHKYEAQSPDTVKPTTKGMSDEVLRPVNGKLSKEFPPHKPLRDVNQILSILQRRNVTETCSGTSMASTKAPPEYDASKRPKIEPISPKAASRDSLPQQFMVRETSSAKTSVCRMTHLNDSPSFDLGI